MMPTQKQDNNITHDNYIEQQMASSSTMHPSNNINELEVNKSGCFSSIMRFFNNITIEPLAFLAIMALYIEFPSIQDLIYTKICLQVVSKYPNTTFISNFNNNSNQNNYLDALNITLLPQQPNLAYYDNRTYFNNKNKSQISFATNFLSIKNLSNQSLDNLSHQGRIQDNGRPNLNLWSRVDNDNDNDNDHDHHHKICDRLNRTAVPKEIREEIAAGDSLFWFKYELVICILCALSSPYWGGMSDKIGRFIPLNVPIFMSVISNSISLTFGLLISLNSHNLFDVQWLYLGAILVGISGGQAVIIINSFSFLSDNTNSESRSKRVVILESVIYIAHSAGYYLSKVIMPLGLSKPERPWLNRHFVAFLTCVLLNLLAILYSFIKLRHRRFHRFSNNFEREQQETFTGDKMSIVTSTLSYNNNNQFHDSDMNIIDNNNIANSDRPRELTSSNPDDLDGPIAKTDKNWTELDAFLTFKYYKQTYETLIKKRESRTIIQLLLLCGFISAMSLTCLMSLLFIYLHTDPFNWPTSKYSSWNSISSLTRGGALICLTLTKLFKITDIPDSIVAAIGFLSKGAGLLMIALAQSGDLIDWAIVAFILSEFSMPPIRSLLSKLVVKEEVCKLYSCLAAIQSICLLVGNIIFYLAFTSIGLQSFFRLCFLIVAGGQFMAVIIMLFIYTTLRNRVMII